MALNAVDGMLAREFGQQSNARRLPQRALRRDRRRSALYLPFALLAGVSPALVVLVMLLAG